MNSKIFLSLTLLFFLSIGVPLCQADDSLEQRGLHLALVPETNVFEQRRKYRYITDYLSEKLGITVHLDIMSNYGQISEAFVNGTADAGFFGSFSYVLTHAKTGIEPIARPVWPDGSSTYRSYIFTRKDSGIKTMEDMKGKNLALVDKATTAGSIFPLYYFKSFGIDNLSDLFANIFFAGSHDVAAWAVYTGEADVGGAKDHIYNALGEEYPDFREQMTTLVESPAVPSNCLAVRKDISPVLKLRIKGLLLNLEETEEGRQVLSRFGAKRFIVTTNEEYNTVHQMVDKLKIDLQNFPY
jgi:phosphonate transport system substrate-binding protein